MYKIRLLHPTASVMVVICSLSGCQTTYSALPAAGGYTAGVTGPESARQVTENQSAELVASVSEPTLVATPRAYTTPSEGAIPPHPERVVSGLQIPSPDTLLQTKQAETPRKFGVTQGAHIVGGALVLAGGITTISGFNSTEPGWEPLGIVVLGVILAIVGGAMLLFRGKTARRRQ